ncbi:hypothetical protein LAZ67_2001663 [Cordylochernes scorpioides]|uniref:Transposase n=1 Tax=Cordylochernes scorpioides TaxID=51811 RepID=A0ABY6K2D0_9ARAC|nr:hypothetical protein LAZ67_2001663 [Cordylochernes scorpioides]
MILANRRITVREVAEDLNIPIGSCHSIFINDLGMRRVAAKFVPKLLNCDQKQHRMNIANEMLDSVRDDPNLLQRVITGDEAGVVHHEFLPQGRTVNKEYYLQVMRNLGEAIRQKRPDLWKNKNWLLNHDNAPAQKSLLVRDFLAKKKNTNDAAATELVHYKFEGQTINQHYYLDVLRSLREAVRQKRPEKWQKKNCVLHHYNARPQTAVTVQLYLAKHGIALLPQPPYSPNIASNDFFVYPKIKKVLNGRRFDSISEIKENSKIILKSLEDEDFQRRKNVTYKVYFWYKRFKDGRESIADDLRTGRSLTSTTDHNIVQVGDLIVADRKITIDNISKILGIFMEVAKK